MYALLVVAGSGDPGKVDQELLRLGGVGFNVIQDLAVHGISSRSKCCTKVRGTV